MLFALKSQLNGANKYKQIAYIARFVCLELQVSKQEQKQRKHLQTRDEDWLRFLVKCEPAEDNIQALTYSKLQSRPEHIRYILDRIDNSFTFNLAGEQQQKPLNRQPHEP